jgi:hypothetical protein
MFFFRVHVNASESARYHRRKPSAPLELEPYEVDLTAIGQRQCDVRGIEGLQRSAALPNAVARVDVMP